MNVNTDMLVAIAIVAPVSLVIIVMAVMLLRGRGANLIAGFNTMSKEAQAQYDAPAMCRFVGKILLPIGVLMPFVLLGKGWLAIVYCVVTVGLSTFAAIYANTGNRFRK